VLVPYQESFFVFNYTCMNFYCLTVNSGLKQFVTVPEIAEFSQNISRYNFIYV